MEAKEGNKRTLKVWRQMEWNDGLSAFWLPDAMGSSNQHFARIKSDTDTARGRRKVGESKRSVSCMLCLALSKDVGPAELYEKR